MIDPALGKALVLSVLLHTLLLAAAGGLDDPVRRAFATHAARFDVTLQPLVALARLRPPLSLDESPSARAPAHAPSAHAGHTANTSRTTAGPELAGEAARQANAQLARELLYPPEAIARGLEGQVLVLLSLDASGNAIAARLEASSGYALLDDAAVHAATLVRALPDSAPREALLPVRFRLR